MMLGLRRIWLRRKRAWLLLAVVAMVLGTSALLSSSVWQESQSFKDDYDLIYDADKGVLGARKVRRGVIQLKDVLVEHQKKTELSQEDEPEGPQKVIFNHNEMVHAKRLTFVPGYPVPDLKSEPLQSAENYDVDNKDGDVNSLVIGQEEEEEEDEGDNLDDDYQYWKENPNPEFKDGDFDRVTGQNKLPFKYSVDSSDKHAEEMMQVAAPLVKDNIGESNGEVTSVNGKVGPSVHLRYDDDSEQNSRLKFEASKLVLCEQFGNCSEAAGRLQLPQLPLPHLQAKKTLQQTDAILPSYVVDEHGGGGSSRGNGVIPREREEEEDSSHVGQQLGLLRDSNQGQEAPEDSVKTLPDTVMSPLGFQVVRDKIYWSLAVEDFVPKGESQGDAAVFMEKSRRQSVKEMHSPSWNRCGRAKNQFIILDDGTELCARYRHPHDKMVQGDVMSLYLSRLLGMDNVPAIALVEANSTNPKWRAINITRAEWEEGTVVAFIQWIQDLGDRAWSKVRMPLPILQAYRNSTPLDSSHPALVAMTTAQLSEMLQWGDMILFDYITGNYDRVASMQDGAYREKKPSVMTETIRNLRRTAKEGKFWLIDNESGLLDSYDLMYKGGKSGDRFIQFHKEMLESICIFHEPLVANIKKLAKYKHPDEILLRVTGEHEPLFKKIPQPYNFKIFTVNFRSRLKEIVKWIDYCEHR